MAKYSQEFKLKVVEHYLSGHGDSVTGLSAEIGDIFSPGKAANLEKFILIKKKSNLLAEYIKTA